MSSISFPFSSDPLLVMQERKAGEGDKKISIIYENDIFNIHALLPISCLMEKKKLIEFFCSRPTENQKSLFSYPFQSFSSSLIRKRELCAQ